MATQTSLPTLWHVPDDLWSLIAPLVGPEKVPGTPGHPAVASRRIFDGILYVLRTGCQWSALPRAEYAPHRPCGGASSSGPRPESFNRPACWCWSTMTSQSALTGRGRPSMGSSPKPPGAATPRIPVPWTTPKPAPNGAS